MTGFTFFVKPCPTCGRNSKIAIAYLGRQVRCRHCLREFTATDSHGESESLNDPVEYWINFTDHDLDLTNEQDFEPRLPR